MPTTTFEAALPGSPLSVPATMPRRRLGQTDLELSIVGVGGWLGILANPDAAARELAAVEAVRQALDLGVNFFDTAPLYAHGDAERYLGLGLRALPARLRAQAHVATKVGCHPERLHQYDAGSVNWSLERSLNLLFTDHLDVVHIHYPLHDQHMDQILGPGGAVEALEKLKAQGVVRAISLGSRPHRFLQRAIESGRFDAVMTTYDYNPIRASAEPVIELAAARGVGVFNASPYNAGLLAGIDPDLAAARRTPDLPGDLERARALWAWANARGVDLGAVAMQFSLRNPHVTTTVVGPRDAAEVVVNIRQTHARLPAGIWDELSELLKSLGGWTPGGEDGVLA